MGCFGIVNREMGGGKIQVEKDWIERIS